jgi:hypothetical protein
MRLIAQRRELSAASGERIIGIKCFRSALPA